MTRTMRVLNVNQFILLEDAEPSPRPGPWSITVAAYKVCRPRAAERVCRNVLYVTRRKENWMSTILIIVLVLLLLGALPTWPHSANWGYYPSGGLGLVLLILLILVLTGRL